MRQAALIADTTTPAALQNIIHQLSPPPPPHRPPATCDPHGGCRWSPPTASNSAPGAFQAYAAIFIIILLCTVICALALSGAIRCFLRRRGQTLPQPASPEAHPKQAAEAPALTLRAAPPVVFSPGMEMAGTEAECAICLTEFVAGEEIRVMAECRHGFHIECIERWLCSHSSCPTCRRNCLVMPSPEREEHCPTTAEPAAIYLELSNLDRAETEMTLQQSRQ